MAKIRTAKLDDLPGILQITNWAICQTASNFNVQPLSLDELVNVWNRTHEQYPWLVSFENGNVLAYALGSPYKARAAYRWTAEVSVYVDPKHQGEGVARALYAALLPVLQAQGYRTLVGAIALPNPASVRLHESFGFTHWGTLERAGRKFDRWHDVGYWRLSEPADPIDSRPPKTVKEATDDLGRQAPIAGK